MIYSFLCALYVLFVYVFRSYHHYYFILFFKIFHSSLDLHANIHRNFLRLPPPPTSGARSHAHPAPFHPHGSPAEGMATLCCWWGGGALLSLFHTHSFRLLFFFFFLSIYCVLIPLNSVLSRPLISMLFRPLIYWALCSSFIVFFLPLLLCFYSSLTILEPKIVKGKCMVGASDLFYWVTSLLIPVERNQPHRSGVHDAGSQDPPLLPSRLRPQFGLLGWLLWLYIILLYHMIWNTLCRAIGKP